jgi:hypothetical protein
MAHSSAISDLCLLDCLPSAIETPTDEKYIRNTRDVIVLSFLCHSPLAMCFIAALCDASRRLYSMMPYETMSRLMAIEL